MNIGGSNGTIASRLRDRAKVNVVTARPRRGEVDNSHLWEGRVGPTGSHRRKLVDLFQFRTPRIT